MLLTPLPPGTGVCCVCAWLPDPCLPVQDQARDHTAHTKHPTVCTPEASDGVIAGINVFEARLAPLVDW